MSCTVLSDSALLGFPEIVSLVMLCLRACLITTPLLYSLFTTQANPLERRKAVTMRHSETNASLLEELRVNLKLSPLAKIYFFCSVMTLACACRMIMMI